MKVTIYSADGTAKYTGCPVFHDTYMGVPYLEFEDVGTPEGIEWEVGDYADYGRTGRRYWIFDLPQPTRNARSGATGNAITYESVKLHGMERQLEIAIFTDLVVNDNGIYYSSREETSTYEDVAGIATRIQAIMDEYFEGEWIIQVVSSSYTDIEIDDTREFTIDGCTVLEALERIYEVWPGLGWTCVEQILNGTRTCVLTIGEPNASDPSVSLQTFSYGKGNGLKVIKRATTNAEDLCTRLYPFGTDENMPTGYYNDDQYDGVIKNYASNDIPNVMLPLSSWGTDDDGLYDPSKAYIQDDDKVAEFGLRPKKVYFDGDDDTEEEIYPSIKGVTAGEIRDAKDELGETEYRPSETIYPDDEEAMDEVKEVVFPDDDGDPDDTSSSTYSGTMAPGLVTSTTNTSHQQNYLYFDLDVEGEVNIYLAAGDTGTISFTNEDDADSGYSPSYYVRAIHVILTYSSSSAVLAYAACSISGSTFTVPTKIYYASGTAASYALGIRVVTTGSVSMTVQFPTTSVTAVGEATGSGYFTLTLKQIGFDLSGTSTDSSGLATVAMTSGKCAGREFTARAVTYQEDTDDWLLKMNRDYDDDLDLYYPNNIYPIEEGDTFVLTNIEMPALYVGLAEQKLLEAATEWYNEHSDYLYTYEADIDAKVMEEGELLLTSGMFVPISDDEVADGGSDYVLIDSLTVTENGDGLPTWEVTFRDKDETKVSSSFKARMEAAAAKAQQAKESAASVSDSTAKAVAIAAAISGDNYVSRAEVPALKVILAEIKADYSEVVTSAFAAGVDTDDYVEAFTAAVTALIKYTTFAGSAKEIEDDYDDITDYYSVKSELMAAVALANSE